MDGQNETYFVAKPLPGTDLAHFLKAELAQPKFTVLYVDDLRKFYLHDPYCNIYNNSLQRHV
jgi:hypothetical protein